MELRRAENGGIDLEALERSVTPELMQDWLLRRLQGRDPYWPIDSHDLEAPERVFIDLWKVSPPDGRIRHALGFACASVLDQAWQAPPEDWHRGLLDLVSIIRPNQCVPLLRRVVERPTFLPEHRSRALDRAWLQAAAAYKWDAEGVRDAWRSLIGDPLYGTIAYLALSTSPTDAVWYLPDLYQATPEQFRRFAVREALRLLLRHGTDTSLSCLRENRSRLDACPGLCKLIDEALVGLGRPAAFVSSDAPRVRGERPRAPSASPPEAVAKLRGMAKVKAAAA